MVEKEVKLDIDNPPSPEDVLESMRENGDIKEEAYKEMKFRFEDIEDLHRLSKYQIYERAYKNDRIGRCIELLLELGEKEPNKFKRSMLLSNAIKNPMSMNFKEDDFKKVTWILMQTIDIAKEKNLSLVFIKSLMDIILYYSVLYHNSVKNTQRLLENKFCTYPLSKQLRMICIFIQDQTRMMREQIISDRKKHSFATGMEMNVANRTVNLIPSQKISFADNYEGTLEYFDTLMRYLFAVKKEDLKKNDIGTHGDIHPFGIPEFQQITYIAQQRMMYTELEEKFRYSDWNVNIRKGKAGEEIYAFFPNNREKFIAHIVASIRREYRYRSNVTRFADIHKMTKALESIEFIAKELDVDSLEELHMDEERFKSACSIAEVTISVYKELSKKYYFQCKFKNMTIDDIILTYQFLYTYSQVYSNASMKKFRPDDNSTYKYLVPVVHIEYFAGEFSNIFHLQKDKAEKLLKCFIYDGSIRGDNGDIFSRPLIRINDSQVLMCESLIEQMNLERCVEKVLQRFNVDLKPVGKEFEEKLVGRLKSIEGIQVNTEHIVFDAYDGRHVEFDFLGTLEDCLLLFEFKSVLIPYDDIEVYKREEVIKEGVDQVNRRGEVIKHNWDIIRSMVNIDLPEKPYHEDKVIKVVCTNIYDFTTLKIEGVRITDESTLLKYFADPFVGVFSKDKEALRILDAKFIWKSGKPTVEEFIEYLDEPVTVGNIPGCFKNEFKWIPVFEGDFLVGMVDVIQEKDPFREAINKKRQVVRGKKVYPNDPCPCGSGKKYKFCCEK